jgi:hypothetical protein
MQAVAMAKDQAYRAGHLPVETGSRTGVRSFVCAHCGVAMRWEHSAMRGTMASGSSRCFPKPGDPLSPRDAERRDLDEEMGWNGTRSAIAEASWAVQASRAMAQSLARGGR